MDFKILSVVVLLDTKMYFVGSITISCNKILPSAGKNIRYNLY